MPGESPSTIIEYRDAAGRLWRASEVARVSVVTPAIDGPNLALVIRFEREGEERFARWVGDPEWREPRTLNRLFELATRPVEPDDKMPAHPSDVAVWVEMVASMGPDELESIERRTFATWDRASLGDLRRAIDRRRRELGRG